MVHILLTILKVLGIGIVVLLSLLLLLLLIVLLGPIGYEAEGKAVDGKISLKAKVSWIFFVVRGNVVYQDNLIWFLRLFGIPVASNEPEFLAKQEEKRKRREEKTGKKEEEKAVQRDSSKEEALQEDILSVNHEIHETSAAETPFKDPLLNEEKVFTEEPSASDKKEEPERKNEKKRLEPGKLWRKLKDSIKNLKEKIRQIPKKIKGFIQKIRDTAEKINRYKEFLFCEENRKVFAFLLGKIKKTVLHILPKKLRGRVEFGMEDPYVMGQILTVLGMLYPVYQDKLEIRPDFEEQKLNGEVSLKGRIIPGYMLLQCVLTILNKEVRRLIRDGRKLIGGNV